MRRHTGPLLVDSSLVYMTWHLLIIDRSSLVMKSLLRVETTLTMVCSDGHVFSLRIVPHVHGYHIYVCLDLWVRRVQLSVRGCWWVPALSEGILRNWRFRLSSNAFLNIFKFQILVRGCTLNVGLVCWSTSRMSLKPHGRDIITFWSWGWILNFL